MKIVSALLVPCGGSSLDADNPLTIKLRTQDYDSPIPTVPRSPSHLCPMLIFTPHRIHRNQMSCVPSLIFTSLPLSFSFVTSLKSIKWIIQLIKGSWMWLKVKGHVDVDQVFYQDELNSMQIALIWIECPADVYQTDFGLISRIDNDTGANTIVSITVPLVNAMRSINHRRRLSWIWHHSSHHRKMTIRAATIDLLVINR